MSSQEHFHAGGDGPGERPGAGLSGAVVRDLHGNLSVRLTATGEHTLVTVAGEVDHACAPTLDRVLYDCLGGTPGGLLVDLAAVGFFDCAGLNALLRAHRLAAESGRSVAVVALSPAVDRVLALTGTRALLVTGDLPFGAEPVSAPGPGAAAPVPPGTGPPDLPPRPVSAVRHGRAAARHLARPPAATGGLPAPRAVR